MNTEQTSKNIFMYSSIPLGADQEKTSIDFYFRINQNQ